MQRDAIRRYAELVQDERLKEKTCRRCPHCGRVVEKLSGCDSMVCGRNYHGGDVQMGCGKPFSWSQARPYVADIGDRKTKDELASSSIVLQATVDHMIFEGEPMLCDSCRQAQHIFILFIDLFDNLVCLIVIVLQPIRGPRIKCINCPDHNICLICDVKSVLPKAAAKVQRPKSRRKAARSRRPTIKSGNEEVIEIGEDEAPAQDAGPAVPVSVEEDEVICLEREDPMAKSRHNSSHVCTILYE